MLRVLLIISFVVVGFLQGISIGNVDLAKTADITGKQVELALATDVIKGCCDDSDIIDKVPTFCKLDCKALLPFAATATGKSIQKHEWKLADDRHSIMRFIDLRPPIS